MYDGGKIIAGLVVFLILLTFPVWYNVGGAPYQEPDLELPEDEEQCIEPTQWIRDNHMKLLDEWRDKFVREKGKTMYESSTGQEVEISLQNTCMDCHTTFDDFCDKCHTTAAVNVYCWDCHVEPEEVSNAQ